jgi:transposase-like protein
MERVNDGIESLKRILRRQRWTAQDAAEVLRAIKQSGLSAAEFCRRHGLGYNRIIRWGGKLGRTPVRRRPKGLFLPIRVVEDQEKAEDNAAGRGSWVAELECEGFRLRVAEAATEELIGRVLAAAKARPC